MGIKKTRAIYSDQGKLLFENGDILRCEILDLPYGSRVQVILEYENLKYHNGTDNYVWATHNLEQAEIISGALLAQNIEATIEEIILNNTPLYLLKVKETYHVEKAIFFIWKGKEGLNLKPDWHYPPGAANESFNRWVNQ